MLKKDKILTDDLYNRVISHDLESKLITFEEGVLERLNKIEKQLDKLMEKTNGK